MERFRALSLEEFSSVASSIARRFCAAKAATVVALSGELGAGKTTFVQAIAREYGILETVNSPTFVIEKVYSLSEAPFEKLIHIDAYRLKEARELEMLGWNDLVSNPANLIFVEWPEKVPGLIPQDAIKVRFDIEGDARIISIDDGQESSEKDS